MRRSEAGDAERIAAGVEIWRTLDGPVPVDDYADLPMAVTSASGCVAIVGLFNRGKSTLINRLVGSEISPTAATPETAIPIEAESGSRSGIGWHDDRQVRLPRAPSRFSPRVSRAAREGLTRAKIQGGFRLPTGIRVVDTPGVGADDLAFGEVWRASGADAALVVVSIPPAFSAEDRRLIDAAESHFGGRVVVAINPVSTDVDDDDVAAVVEHVSEILERRVLIVPADAPVAPWGEDGRWQACEDALLQLAEQAASRAAQRVRSYDHDNATTSRWVAAHAWSRRDVRRLRHARRLARTAGVPLQPAVEAALVRAKQVRRAFRVRVAAVAAAASLIAGPTSWWIVGRDAVGEVADETLTAAVDRDGDTASERGDSTASQTTSAPQAATDEVRWGDWRQRAAAPRLAGLYGDDASLDRLWDRCSDRDWDACDELREQAKDGSGYAGFAARCGGAGMSELTCAASFAEPKGLGDDPVLDRLWRGCERGNPQSCDTLYSDSPTDSRYERFGGSCGGAWPGANGTCVAQAEQEKREQQERLDEQERRERARQNARVEDVHDVFRTYVNGINSADYAAAYSTLSASAQRRTSYGEFVHGVTTSVLSGFVIETIEQNVSRRVVLVASFMSRQAPEDGPDGESCTDWMLRYTVIRSNGAWRIDSALGAYGAGHNPC